MSKAGERLYHVVLPVRASETWAVRANSKAEAAARVGVGAGALIRTSIPRRTTGVRGYSVVEVRPQVDGIRAVRIGPETSSSSAPSDLLG